MSLRDRARERQLLTSLGGRGRGRGRSARPSCRALRLLKRIAEPVIVFTEYRDTLATRRADHRTARRHPARRPLTTGTLGGAARVRAGEPAILLATDAAGEGLNLQRACRIVINLELPWNPMRLEQRIGTGRSHRPAPDRPRVSPRSRPERENSDCSKGPRHRARSNRDRCSESTRRPDADAGRR